MITVNLTNYARGVKPLEKTAMKDDTYVQLYTGSMTPKPDRVQQDNLLKRWRSLPETVHFSCLIFITTNPEAAERMSSEALTYLKQVSTSTPTFTLITAEEEN